MKSSFPFWLAGTAILSGIGALVLSADEAATASAQPVVPPHPVTRYESLWKQSLFRSQSGAASRASQSEWNLAGVFEIEGKKGAVIVNEKTGAIQNVTLEAPNEDGFQLLAVQSGGNGAPPRVEIAQQNGSRIWVTARKMKAPTPKPPKQPNRSLVNRNVPDTNSAKSQPESSRSAPSPLDVPALDVPLPDKP
ncbi:MAG: hypothetical protein HKN23_18120 [Verrucomicrobiales bacterium]|nr:hypothetical protein [Verrucomicrobiales bacterium]